MNRLGEVPARRQTEDEWRSTGFLRTPIRADLRICPNQTVEGRAWANDIQVRRQHCPTNAYSSE